MKRANSRAPAATRTAGKASKDGRSATNEGGATRQDQSIETVRKDYISQIEAEDLLVGQRMGWMLQFNGFLIASYGLALKEGAALDLVRRFLASVPFIGLAVTLLSLLGIWSALIAATVKGREWQAWMRTALSDPEAHPMAKPHFLSGSFAWYGSMANGFGLPLVVTGFWLWMLFASNS